MTETDVSDKSSRAAARTPRRKPSPRTDAAEREIRRWMVQRHHRAGDRLPPDVELAKMLGVARSTVITALDRLEQDGIITRRQGSGTFVRIPPLADDARTGFETFDEAVALVGDPDHPLVVNDVIIAAAMPVNAAGAAALGIVQGTLVTRIHTTASIQGELVLSSVTSLHPDADLTSIDNLQERLLEGDSLLGLLAEIGVTVAYSRSEVTARVITASDSVGAQLGVHEPIPAVQITDVAHRPSGEPAFKTVDVIRGSALPLHLLRQVDTAHAASPRAVGSTHLEA